MVSGSYLYIDFDVRVNNIFFYENNEGGLYDERI
jgi:hypothetical protein